MTTAELNKATEVNQERLPVFQPAATINESESVAEIILDMPGVEETGLDIRVEKEHLIIEGRVAARNPEDKKAVYTEFNFGNFRRKFKIPRPVDVENARAVIKNGRVKITVPYSQEVARKIQVTSA